VLGDDALLSLTSGLANTANGHHSLLSNTTGPFNTAIGYSALFSNTTGVNNTATGGGALLLNTTGSGNTATGDSALYNNTTGGFNTANGAGALSSNTTGSRNIAVGFQAGHALTTGSNNIYIGNRGGGFGECSSIRIGMTGTQNATFIAGISRATVPTGVAVIVDADGKLGTVVSSERFKDSIQPMDEASEAILRLEPVTFRYKHELDPDGIPQFGLVAEQVEKVNPDLVVRDNHGKPYTVCYEAVNAMLLNEFLKAHRKLQQQEATITELKSTVAQQQKESRSTAAHQQNEIKALAATVKERAAQIQKVSAQVELSKPARRTVLNNQ